MMTILIPVLTYAGCFAVGFTFAFLKDKWDTKRNERKRNIQLRINQK